MIVRGVADVEANVHALPLPAKVAVDPKFRSPNIVCPAVFRVPAKPVKFRLRLDPAPNVRLYVPVVKLKLMELASLKAPVLMLDAVAVPLETLTTCVPVVVRFVAVRVFHRPPVPLTVMFPVPKAMVRTLELLLANNPAVSVKL